jgi:riboflavin synthase
MFTGLVETIGILRRRTGRPVARAAIDTSLGPLTLGESINVHGACLNVDRIIPGGFECDMTSETLDRSTLGTLPLGTRVHLERATPLGGRMGGHIVLGHVDGVGRVTAREPKGDAIRFEVRVSAELSRYLASKGSICINGVSLTLNMVGDMITHADGVDIDVMLVPATIARTLLGEAGVGAHVNIEVDVLARYVARQFTYSAHEDRAGRDGINTPAWQKESLGEKNESDVDHDRRILAKLRSGGFL